MEYPEKFLKLIDSFKKLPGIGAKSAERMAYDFLLMKKEDIDSFIDSLKSAGDISTCPVCGNMAMDNDKCEICKDNTRDDSIICVVSKAKDVYALEKMNEYHGMYHVLNGYISPSKGIGYEDINLASLFERIKDGNIKEIILATDLTMEGELTSMYVTKLLAKYENIKVTRLAHGLPMGAQLDYADEMTLFRAFSNREEVEK